MPKFVYKAKEGPEKIIDGTIDADNVDQAISQIIQKGLSPIDVLPKQSTTIGELKKTKAPGFNLIKKIRSADLVLFTRQMSDLVDASVPILQALQIVEGQTNNNYLREKVRQMYTTVRDGGSFSEALEQHRDIFSILYINMVKTGEISGRLNTIMGRLADYLEKEQETRGKIFSSLAYPMLIFIVGLITIFVLLSFVIPRMSVMFDDFDQALPLPTVILTNISYIFAGYWWLMLAVLAVLGVYFRSWISTESGKLKFDTWKLRLPLLGHFLTTVEVGRFSRTLATLIESGVDITSALNSVWATINNAVLREEIKQVSGDVASGSSLKEALQECSFFPDMAVNMISVGEETGSLENGLHKIADAYDRQSEQNAKTMISLLGPAVLIVIVLFVGFVVIAMLLPILQMNMLI